MKNQFTSQRTTCLVDGYAALCLCGLSAAPFWLRLAHAFLREIFCCVVINFDDMRGSCVGGRLIS